METGDKNWAQQYLIDPLTAPDPSQETGPGSHFRPDSEASVTKTTINPKSPSTHSRSSSAKLTKNNPYRQSLESPTTPTSRVNRSASVNTKPSYPTPPTSSPHSPHSPNYRQSAFNENGGTRPRRSSSLTAKYPGDMSHRPLDTLTKEKYTADRIRHATRKHHIRPDSIDKLDNVAGSYHHGGPYDATLFARNNSKNSPLDAVSQTNAEALKATPREKIVDSVQSHRPLDGVAAFAPGQMDRNGHLYQYEHGENMMTDLNPGGGAYKRWPGVQYHEDDIKGKGEPSYSIEKALKEHTLEGKEGGIEMKTHSRNASGNAPYSDAPEDDATNFGRSGNLKGLRKRIGSLKKHMGKEDQAVKS